MLFSWLITISMIEFFQAGIDAVKAVLPFGLIMVLPVTIIWRAEWIADRPQYNNIGPRHPPYCSSSLPGFSRFTW
jgi:hypothetical protein